jgi:hypothetical protein
MICLRYNKKKAKEDLGTASPAVPGRYGRQCRPDRQCRLDRGGSAGPTGSAGGEGAAVPVNRKNRQICSRLKHCSSNFHKTMHKVIHLYGKTYGKNRPPIFLLERSTQSREGERGGRLTGGGSHGGEGGPCPDQPTRGGRRARDGGRRAGATAAAAGVGWEEETRAGEEKGQLP